jgi:hypothetical protein
MFLHLVRFVVHVVHSGASEPRNIDAIFFMLGWSECNFHKKRTGTRYAELAFLHPLRSMGNVVHCGPSGARNVDTFFFLFGWHR